MRFWAQAVARDQCGDTDGGVAVVRFLSCNLHLYLGLNGKGRRRLFDSFVSRSIYRSGAIAISMERQNS